MTEFHFDNAEGSETRTKKLNIIEEEIDTLQAVSLKNFSTTEKDTGLKWIDGRNIYEKTIIFGAVGTGAQSVAHGITGLDFVINANGYAEQANGVNSIIPRLSISPATTSIFYDRVDETLIYGYIGTSFVSTVAIVGGAITIKYTKV